MTDERIVETLEGCASWWPEARWALDAIRAGYPPQVVWREVCAAFAEQVEDVVDGVAMKEDAS